MKAPRRSPLGGEPLRGGAFRLDDLERIRDLTMRRLPALRVGGTARALRFLNEVGIASLYAMRTLHLPCLWVAVCGRREPRFPEHSHYDPETALTWEIKDTLPAARKVYYGKLIRGRPAFVALDLLPDVLRLRRSERDHRQEYRDGLLSPAAKAILDALHRRSPRDTFELKLAANLLRPPQRRAFDNAIAELQQRMRIVMRRARYEPAFTYEWDLVEARFPEAVRAARRRRPEIAAERVAGRYLEAVAYAKPEHVAAVVGNDRVVSAVERLVRAGRVLADQRIDGLPGKWLVVIRKA